VGDHAATGQREQRNDAEERSNHRRFHPNEYRLGAAAL
jgi:hypothetical protein